MTQKGCDDPISPKSRANMSLGRLRNVLVLRKRVRFLEKVAIFEFLYDLLIINNVYFEL